MAGINTTMRWNRWKSHNPAFGVLVIALSTGAVIVAGHTAWYGAAILFAVGLAYLVAISTPGLLKCAAGHPTSNLRRVIFLCSFIAIFLALFIGRNYRVVPWPEDAASLSTYQVQDVLRAYRTLLFGVCTIVAVAYLQVIRLVLRYLHEERNTAPGTASQVPVPLGSAPEVQAGTIRTSAG
jgi:hypothetical protein